MGSKRRTSMCESISPPRILPSLLTAVRCLVLEGCRFVVAAMSSMRSKRFSHSARFHREKRSMPGESWTDTLPCLRTASCFHLPHAELCSPEAAQRHQRLVNVIGHGSEPHTVSHCLRVVKRQSFHYFRGHCSCAPGNTHLEDEGALLSTPPSTSPVSTRSSLKSCLCPR